MRLFHRRFTEPGACPGTVVANESAVAPLLHELAFNAETLDERERATVAELSSLKCDHLTTWIDVRGLGDGTVIQQIGEKLNLHPLAIADVLNVGQRPKVDMYDDFVFMAMRVASLDSEDRLHWEQLTLFIGPCYLVTFQETHRDCLEPLRARLRKGLKLVRSGGSNQLAVSVMDVIVDGYFPLLEHYGDRLEQLEDDILLEKKRDVLQDLYLTKRDLAGFRRSTWPLRKALVELHRSEESGFNETTDLHLRDTVDHAMQVVEVNETYRELTASLVDVHLSIVGQHTNDVMRVLTVVSAIFIPMTFVAGVYGMNFDTTKKANLPELGWSYGYWFFWGVCLTIALALLVLFRRLGWLGSTDK